MVWVGAVLVLVGLAVMVVQPLRQGGRLSRGQVESDVDQSLEPRGSGSGFGLRGNWLGILLFGVGVILLLIPAFVTV